MNKMKKEETNLKAKVIPLVELTDYQEDSIVSRTIIDKETGTVTVFAFDKEQRLSAHTVPYDALVQILEGEAKITISGKNYHLKDGEIIIMPASEPHALKAVTRFKMMLIMIKSGSKATMS